MENDEETCNINEEYSDIERFPFDISSDSESFIDIGRIGVSE